MSAKQVNKIKFLAAILLVDYNMKTKALKARVMSSHLN